MPENLFQKKIKMAVEQCKKKWVPSCKLGQRITRILGDKTVRSLRFCNLSLVLILLRLVVPTPDERFNL